MLILSGPLDINNKLIREIKLKKQECFTYYLKHSESDIESDTIMIDDFTLFELGFYIICNQDADDYYASQLRLTYKMFVGEDDYPKQEVNFNEFQYSVYTDYLKIYEGYGYERIAISIPNHIMEEYIYRKENPKEWEEERYKQEIYDGKSHEEAAVIPYFKNEFCIPEKLVIKYRQNKLYENGE